MVRYQSCYSRTANNGICKHLRIDRILIESVRQTVDIRLRFGCERAPPMAVNQVGRELGNSSSVAETGISTEVRKAVKPLSMIQKLEQQLCAPSSFTLTGTGRPELALLFFNVNGPVNHTPTEHPRRSTASSNRRSTYFSASGWAPCAAAVKILRDQIRLEFSQGLPIAWGIFHLD